LWRGEYIQVVEGFEHLKSQQFSDNWRERLFEFALLFDEEVEAGGHVVHDHAEVALLGVERSTSRTILRKYSFMATMLQ
jgi:hypothetical protein